MKFKFKRKRKGDPKMRLRPHPSEKEDIPMGKYFGLYARLMGNNTHKTDENEIQGAKNKNQ